MPTWPSTLNATAYSRGRPGGRARADANSGLALRLGLAPANRQLQVPAHSPYACERGAGQVEGLTVLWYHETMAKNFTVRLDDQSAADAEALARAEGKSLNETVKLALSEAVERRRRDPKFKSRIRRIIDQDRELLERLAK